jgi:hypothetical protein
MGRIDSFPSLYGQIAPDPWTDFVPVLSQGVVVTKTVSYARYCRIGRMITACVELVVTGAGTGGSSINITLPVTAVRGTNHYVVGTGWAFDTSASQVYVGASRAFSTTNTDILQTNSGAATIGSNPNFALAAGDEVAYQITYEAAS